MDASRGRRLLHLATAAYAFHLATTLILTLACGRGFRIPRLSGFYLGGDLKALVSLTLREPVAIALFALCLAAWHAFAIECLVRPWMRRHSAQ